MLSYRVIVSLIHVLLAAPLLYYAGACLKWKRKCVDGFGDVLIGLALGLFLYHGYKLFVNLNYTNKEYFVRQGGYLGLPLNSEGFVPFSYPYQHESERYYSYHDDQHTRNCNCVHNDGHQGCHHTSECGHKHYKSEEPFDTVEPSDESYVKSKL